MPYNIVWFKKDLRTKDHAPLFNALKEGSSLGLFIIEPEWLNSPEFDSGHYVFLQESLRDLQSDLRKIGVPLLIEVGEAVATFGSIHQRFGIKKVFSHEETGLDWTFQRDLKIKRWCKSTNTPWREYLQFGVIRALKNRDTWLDLRNQILHRNLFQTSGQEWPKTIDPKPVLIPSLKHLELPPSEKIHAQKGGRNQAEKVLNSFFDSRSLHYSKSMSSPTLSASGCSRISPYLAWGNLSITEVLTQLAMKRTALGSHPEDRWWMKNLDAFESRIAWHCHFIQKFESEPEIEFQNMNRAFDGMRENNFNEEWFEAWCKGETGFPMIDAAMRSLKINGWINFRMRAALMSFASYQLWLHWRKPAQFLAKHFIDFEPGIHFSQAQMQSGVTGINTIRIYSPKKQAVEQDPHGEFIRKYCQELESLPTADLAEPHLTPPLIAASVGFVSGVSYPEPIVDPELAYNSAKKRIFEWMEKPTVRRAANSVYQKHGSRSRIKT